MWFDFEDHFKGGFLHARVSDFICSKQRKGMDMLSKATLRISVYLLTATWVLSCLLGCGMSRYEKTLRTRAAFDFGCPQEQIRITTLDYTTRGVEGCGMRATYVLSGTTGAWILNTDAMAQPAPVAPAPAPAPGAPAPAPAPAVAPAPGPAPAATQPVPPPPPPPPPS